MQIGDTVVMEVPADATPQGLKPYTIEGTITFVTSDSRGFWGGIPEFLDVEVTFISGGDDDNPEIGDIINADPEWVITDGDHDVDVH
tara:strand:- start:2637 stop:2897 length:261 start_codon:yes stop_codon:yes gene_type:complete